MNRLLWRVRRRWECCFPEGGVGEGGPLGWVFGRFFARFGGLAACFLLEWGRVFSEYCAVEWTGGHCDTDHHSSVEPADGPEG